MAPPAQAARVLRDRLWADGRCTRCVDLGPRGLDLVARHGDDRPRSGVSGGGRPTRSPEVLRVDPSARSAPMLDGRALALLDRARRDDVGPAGRAGQRRPRIREHPYRRARSSPPVARRSADAPATGLPTVPAGARAARRDALRAAADACVDLSSRQAWLTDGDGQRHLRPGGRARRDPEGPDADRHVLGRLQGPRPRQQPLRRRHAELGVLRPGDRVPQGQPVASARTAASTSGAPRRSAFFSNLSPGDTVEVVS